MTEQRAVEAPWSDLLRAPATTIELLKNSAQHRVLLRRRDDEDVVLTTVARSEQEVEVVSATTKMFMALMRRGDVCTLVTEIIPEAFPWVRFLEAEHVRAFVVELVETLNAVAELDNPQPVATVIAAWRNTAAIHADPELAQRLREEGRDFGPVPEPLA
ncbi:hypothetical protein NLX83_07465 [Allokutzneria sp. A3M-2-11 16]|uniref:hypothetical protein n=1 Tax=Allokutzneria sp. A3M-2-11 16 TaxID=2962043 RepID=UPI0020B87D8E|nr:hypothetical protein [Allokutzneria sp. A3M-2-11 16]MCP3799090.1 hypothetical protein [Allokutzneria sp. A3M-2-11 16]